MLLLLALLGCSPQSNDLTTDPGVGPSHPPAPSTAPRIETQLAVNAMATRPAPPPAQLPEGGPVYHDCGAGPWPALANNRYREAEEVQRPAKRPSPKPSASQPRPRPSPPVASSPAPSPAPSPQAGSAPSAGGAPAPLTIIRGASRSGDAAVPTPDAPRDASKPQGQPAAAPPPPPPEVVTPSQDPASGPSAEPTATAPAYKGAPTGSDIGGVASGEGSEGQARLERAKETAGAELKKDGNTAVVGGELDRLGYVSDKTVADQRNEGDRWNNKQDLADNDAERPEEEDEIEPQDSSWWDWGATVHLSNDDSMSLASAQRVLWSVMNNKRPQLSEIRPHELLNYFSFDTVPVQEGQLFSVLGSAEAQGDTLSVALAVQGGIPTRQALDLTLVVDTSGSMGAEGRMDYTRRGLNQMVDQLLPGDRVDLVTFESRVCTTLTNYVVGRDDPALLQHAMGALTPKGSTDLDGGLREAYRVQKSRSAAETHGRNRRVMLITDAFLNTGAVDAHVVSEIGSSFDESGIRLTGVGVGRDFNDEVLDKLTEKGKGAYVYLGSEAVVDRVFGAGFDSLVRTLAHDVRFSLNLPSSLAMERFYGEEASTDPTDIQPINYYAGTSQVFLQDLKIKGGELVLSDPLTLRIEWRDAITGEPDALELQTTVGALVDGERRNLHKAQALMAWADWTRSWAGYGDACGQGLDDYALSATKLDNDAELSFLTDLVQSRCGRKVVAAAPPVAYKVKVDSDIPIAEVGLACGSRQWTETMRGGDTVARFDSAAAGSCTLTLQGNVAMRAAVDVPATGGDVRCTVRGGRLSCS